MSPKSPFYEIFNKRLLNALETGLIDQWINTFYQDEEIDKVWKSTKMIYESFVSLRLDYIKGALILLLVGYLLSIICFLIELSLVKKQ